MIFPLLLLFSLFLIFSSSAPLHQMGGMEERKAEEDNTEPDKRSKLAAFLLSFFLGGFGADWFYLSRGDITYIMVGIIKLLLIGYQEGMEKCFGPCSWIVGLGVILWWVVDWARVLTNNFPDGNGLELLMDL